MDDLVARLAQEPDIRFAGRCAPDPASLSVELQPNRPDLLLFDAASLGQDEIQSLRLIRLAAPTMRLVLLLDELRTGLVVAILRNRIHGFLMADCLPDVYVRAIRAVAHGDVWMPRALLARALSDILDPVESDSLSGEHNLASQSATSGCTDREQQVVELVRQGLSNKEIARRLGIMEDTVKKHLQHVYDKLGMRRRTMIAMSGGRAAIGATEMRKSLDDTERDCGLTDRPLNRSRQRSATP